MGGISKLVSALPGGDKALASGQVDESAMDRMEIVINSMTKQERSKPDVINGSRRARIAAGAGVTVHDVNDLMKKYAEARKMVKKMAPAMAEPPRGKKARARRARKQAVCACPVCLRAFPALT